MKQGTSSSLKLVESLIVGSSIYLLISLWLCDSVVLYSKC